MVGIGCRTGIDGGTLLLVAPLRMTLGLLVGWLLLMQILEILEPLPGPLRLRLLVKVRECQPLEIPRGEAIGKGILLLCVVVVELFGSHDLS